ncbi:MAG: glycosyltransferase family 4 protein [Patescibacteria group bacterium]
MRIYFITPKLDFLKSGGSTMEYDLMYRWLMKAGQEVHVITTTPERNNIPFDLPYDVITNEPVLLNKGQMHIQTGVFKLMRKYAHKADVFHIDGQVYLYGAGLYRMLGGKVPVFAYYNRELTAWPENISPFLEQKRETVRKRLRQKIRWYIERYIGMPMANHIDFFTITNPYLLKAFEDFGYKSKDKCFIIGDPFDYKTLMQEQGITSESYIRRNKRDGKVTLYAAGRMVAGKGFDLLITALSKVKHIDKIHLLLGGKGPEEPLIRKMITDYKLEEVVELIGWVTKEQVYENYKRTDIFVHPRWRPEIISITLMETMTFGLPTILPEGTGLQWVTGPAALPFAFDDPDDFAKKIDQLVMDADLRAQLSRMCYERLEDDEINYEKNMARLLDVMKKLTQKK